MRSWCLLSILLLGPEASWAQESDFKALPKTNAPFIRVLGIAQDAGYPQAGCRKECCQVAWADQSLHRHATSLAICDPATGDAWLLDCTPDFKHQLPMLQSSPSKKSGHAGDYELQGIFLTHAHIGHYAGMIHLGREVMGASSVRIFAMPRMSQFLQSNGPWDQLVNLRNIQLQPLADQQSIQLNQRLSITPFLVPHRDEYSETVGFRIEGPERKAVFIPDIDKWERWDRPIEELIRSSDVAYLDGTFYGNGEIPGRDLSQIPHPFIQESLQRFEALPKNIRNRIRFIHLNHTNPALQTRSAARKIIEETGCHVAEQGEVIEL